MKCHKRDSKTKAAFALEELKGKAVAHPCRSISTAKPSITNGASRCWLTLARPLTRSIKASGRPSCSRRTSD
jgi:hypothetical protein